MSFSQAKVLILKQRLSADEVQKLESAPQAIFTERDKEVLFYFILLLQKLCNLNFPGFFSLSIISLFQGEEDHTLLFHSVKSGNKQAFDVVLKRSDVNWQNDKGTLREE